MKRIKKKIKHKNIREPGYGYMLCEVEDKQTKPILGSHENYCIYPGCGNRATCAQLDVRTKQPVPNKLCVHHWEMEYLIRNPNTDVPKGRLTKTGKFIKTPVKKGSVGKAVNEYLDRVGLKKANFEEMRDIVLAVKPDSKYNKGHFNWYCNQYKKKHG